MERSRIMPPDVRMKFIVNHPERSDQDASAAKSLIDGFRAFLNWMSISAAFKPSSVVRDAFIESTQITVEISKDQIGYETMFCILRRYLSSSNPELRQVSFNVYDQNWFSQELSMVRITIVIKGSLICDILFSLNSLLSVMERSRIMPPDVRMKFIVNHPERSDQDASAAKSLIDGFRAFLNWMSISAAFKPSSVVRDAFIESTQITVEISKDQIGYETMFCILRRYLSSSNPELRQVSFNVYDQNWFSQELSSAHLSLPLNRVGFGSLFNGKLSNHWQIPLIDHRSGNDRKSSILIKSFVASFEYDRNMVLVRLITQESWKSNRQSYENGRKSFDNNKKDDEENSIYNIMVNTRHIHRMIVDVNNSFTQLHLELACPAVIKRGTFFKNGDIHRVKYKRQLYLTDGCNGTLSSKECLVDTNILTLDFDKLEDKTLYEILSRLRSRLQIPVEFAAFEELRYPCYKTKKHENCKKYNVDRAVYTPYCPTKVSEVFLKAEHLQYPEVEKRNRSYFENFLEETFGELPYLVENNDSDISEDQKLKYVKYHDRQLTHYLIEALLSRGCVIKNQVLLGGWEYFLQVIKDSYQKYGNTICDVLQDILLRIDENKPIGNIMLAIPRLAEEKHRMGFTSGLTLTEQREGFEIVRKVVVTPTRNVLLAPEVVMGNRVLRRYEPENILRVTFRDDDNDPFRKVKITHQQLEITMQEALLDGFVIAGKHYFYLGSSNSQLREGGAYFMVGINDNDRAFFMKKNIAMPPIDVSIIRSKGKLGNLLDLKYIEKYMARLGQCFTQTRESLCKLEERNILFIPDLIGGSKCDGKEYTFSDGVGCISMERASVLRDEMGFKSTPSCFQFRFRGLKGVIAVNTALDERHQWAIERGFKLHPDRYQFFFAHMAFRQSQEKFIVKATKEDRFEMVKFSGVSRVSLNRPFIMILDQSSEQMSVACHKRIVNRIEVLLDKQIRGLALMLIDEEKFIARLMSLPNRLDVELLKQTGFQLTNEPFFRSMIKAAVMYSVVRQLRKVQISIPPSFGRCMFGVIDETGLLQSGQVFVQYTDNSNDYIPRDGSKTSVPTGRVLVTKNPSIVCGDVRVFEVIDLPELHHLVDVIVFPQHGPRPHSDEMAGSDLDGDEYTVVWDPELLLDYNVPAAVYDTVHEQKEVINFENLNEKMCTYFCNYLQGDSVGLVSNAHLFQADLRGINSKVCGQLSEKVNQAVDFPKTGIPPKPLTTDWTCDEEDDDEVPPEKTEMYPDFHVNNDYMPIYYSTRLIGRLYRSIRAIEDSIRLSEEANALSETQINVDPDLIQNGWERYKNDARLEMENYNGKIRTIMEAYGIRKEGELMSGCISYTRNRISNPDDMSYFNTEFAIKQRVTAIVKEFRERFFKEFGGWESSTDPLDDREENTDILKTKCRDRPGMKEKASAYYMVCYDTEVKSEMMLSFPWVVSDVLADIKVCKALSGSIEAVVKDPPLHKHLKEHCEEYCSMRRKEMGSYQERMNAHWFNIYFKKYPNLRNLCFLLCQWWRKMNDTDTNIRDEHISLLLIRYAISNSPGGFGNERYIDKIIDSQSCDITETRLIAKPYQLFIGFLDYLSSRTFKSLDSISFLDMKYKSVLRRGVWLQLHEAAIRTYYNIVFSMKFDDLPINSKQKVASEAVTEMDPFIIIIPASQPLMPLEQGIVQATGITEVHLRRADPRYLHRVTVVSRGNLNACYRLKKFLAVSPEPHMPYDKKETYDELQQMTYDKIKDSVTLGPFR